MPKREKKAAITEPKELEIKAKAVAACIACSLK